MNSLADVLVLTPAPSWHECVAIVQEVAGNLQPGQPLPALEDLLVESDGSITFGFAGESVRPQVADLASLLASLLGKTEAPQGLLDLANENAGDQPAHATIASFSRALAFFERPNRRGDLQALAGRLEGQSHAVQAERTLAEIRERVVRKSEEEQKQTTSAPTPKKTDRSRAMARARALAIAAAVVLAAAAVSAMTVLRGWNSRPPEKTASAAEGPTPAPSGDAEEKATDAALPAEHAVSTGHRIPSEHRQPVGTPAIAHEKTVSTARIPDRSRGAARSSDSGLPRTGLAPVRPLSMVPSAKAGTGRPTRVERAEDPPAVARAMDAGASASLAAGAVYTSGDAAVTPPAWYRRQLPTEPSPDSTTGYFDIVIDTNGDVESVRLESPKHRYEERMLLAAAKAWKFVPARLNGQPVKYRMRVPITLTWTVDR